MLSFLPGPIRAVLSGILYTLLTFGIALLILFFGIFWWIIPHRAWRHKWMEIMLKTGTLWGDLNQAILWLTVPIKWDIQGLEGLSTTKSYILIANHQSWMDIVMIQTVFNHKIPLGRYFIKKELMRIPIVSWACWLLDFPFMQRYSRETLKKHPELKGKDIETARRSCEKFKEFPVTLVNFVEGTRFSFAKRDQKNLTYQHLLMPKGGGVAFALATMGNTIHEILNVTLVYSVPEPVLWDFFTGKIPPHVTVRIERIPVTPDLIGDYQGNPEFRRYFQLWLNGIWRQKDALISTLVSSNQEKK